MASIPGFLKTPPRGGRRSCCASCARRWSWRSSRKSSGADSSCAIVCDWEGDYWKQPFGRATWKSYLIVTGLFMLAHSPLRLRRRLRLWQPHLSVLRLEQEPRCLRRHARHRQFPDGPLHHGHREIRTLVRSFSLCSHSALLSKSPDFGIDLSGFMKNLLQRFTRRHNHRTKRRGNPCMETFKSVVAEDRTPMSPRDSGGHLWNSIRIPLTGSRECHCRFPFPDSASCLGRSGMIGESKPARSDGFTCRAYPPKEKVPGR